MKKKNYPKLCQNWQPLGYFCGLAAPVSAAGGSTLVTAAGGGNVNASLLAGARTYVTAYVAGEIGKSFNVETTAGLIESSVAHGMLGGVMNVLGGGGEGIHKKDIISIIKSVGFTLEQYQQSDSLNLQVNFNYSTVPNARFLVTSDNKVLHVKKKFFEEYKR